jgi:hypothetical protein
MPREQVGISLSPTELEVVEKIAKKTGRTLAAVLRDCALEGLEAQMAKVERMEAFLKKDKTPNE